MAVPSLSIKDEVLSPICSSCGKLIHPREKAVAFLCPNCGEVLIWRDYHCRKQGIPYTCPKCGFEGP
ncbi:RNA-binding protein [Sulfodiicoccus acidiphilus]|uniref:RNA-binding protein n=1 Tax=Sulfodiicoccus acidiphilus TaxID=1670455 RepID=A0A348B2Q0_9CREN|nr:zinc finger domain-containing protein [Sulfodiicoccus acidiphilus]BBD72452.1 RNA-binding protein [Sulfodiicoccus acidiphilus]GGT97041.1 RNA-binding protein [Sulfodiicoccus acidiphilus]